MRNAYIEAALWSETYDNYTRAIFANNPAQAGRIGAIRMCTVTKIKTSELTGAALDWAVAKCEGYVEYPEDSCGGDQYWYLDAARAPFCGVIHKEAFKPSTDWARGGPIIEREKIAIDWDHDCWNASTERCPAYYSASTPLIAAMRCYVASKLGDEVDVPEELLECAP
jgi:hypothetical protein